MGSKIGILKIAAKRVGLSFEDYLAQIEAGLKWCNSCRTWKETGKFGNDRTRGDGLDAKCLACRHVKNPTYGKGRVSTFKGQKHTEEAKRKMSRSRKGKPSPKKGFPRTLSDRQKISIAVRLNAPRGPRNARYKDGKSAERRGLRFTNEYLQWRYDVFTRDKFTCQHCGDNRGRNLNAHHIKSFTFYPELRLEISNGLTLCEACHAKVHDKPDSTRKLRRLRQQAA